MRFKGAKKITKSRSKLSNKRGGNILADMQNKTNEHMEELQEYFDEVQQNFPNLPTSNQKDIACAPDKSFQDGSCISLKSLLAMADAYNIKYPNKTIKLNTTMETLRPKLYKQYLVIQFSKRLGDICDSQKCWVKQDFTKILEDEHAFEMAHNTWRPKSPQGQYIGRILLI